MKKIVIIILMRLQFTRQITLIMLVFLRHAQRGDNEFPRQFSQVSFDPPVTTDSQATITQTAEELLDLFQKHKIGRVKIICSKFLRCLMTAEKIAAALKRGGMEVLIPFQIQYKVGEYMREDWFKEYPLEKLIFDGIYRKKYIDQEQWRLPNEQKKLPFPENYVMFHQRVGEYKEKMTYPEPGEVTLIVTHGFVVREMCWRMNQVPNIMSEVPYCGYAVFVHKNNQDVLLRAKL